MSGVFYLTFINKYNLGSNKINAHVRTEKLMSAEMGGGSGHLAFALRESEQRLRSLVETSLQGKLVFRPGEFLFANSMAATLLGYPKTESLLASRDALQQLTRIAHEPDGGAGRLAGGQAITGRRTLTRADGTQMRAEIIARMMHWEGKPACVLAFIDVSKEERALRELILMQTEAEAAARAKERFLSAASHDLRTPLHAAMGRLQLLAQHSLTAAAKDLADGALIGCRRLLHQIDDILDAAALETGELPLVRETFEIGPAIDQAVATARDSDPDRVVSVSVNAPTARLIGDERRVRRVVLALIEEAFARDPHGPVDVDVTVEGQGVTIAASGEVLRFGAQIGAKQQTGLGGLGMGRALAGAMGGVVVERATPGAPWQVSAFIPLAAAPEAKQPTTNAHTVLDVLVVEDNPGNRALLRLVLEQLGCRPHLAEGGAQGVAAAASRPFDLVLMDLSMPGMNRFEATRRIRALDVPWANLPIAALTASTAPGVQEAAAAAGMDAFLQKPVEIARLAEAIILLANRSVDRAELHGVEQEDHGDEPENETQRDQGSPPKIRDVGA
jgi:PAS domain S-box-containing protein